jgi:hypothetical protein
MECVPTASADVAKDATPPLSVPVPMVVDPFLKVTVPAGVPPEDVTFAVKVTAWSKDEGFTEALSAVAEVALFMVSVSAAELLPL